MPPAAAAIFWLAAWEFIRTEEAAPLFIAGSTVLPTRSEILRPFL